MHNDSRHNNQNAARSVKRLLSAIIFTTLIPIVSCGQDIPSAALINARSTYQKRSRALPLWHGSRFTEADRARALERGLRFIYRTALVKRNFDEYGHDYLWCFYTIGTSVKDAAVREMAHRMGIERAHVWRREHPRLPPNADAGTIANYAFGCDVADS